MSEVMGTLKTGSFQSFKIRHEVKSDEHFENWLISKFQSKT